MRQQLKESPTGCRPSGGRQSSVPSLMLPAEGTASISPDLAGMVVARGLLAGQFVLHGLPARDEDGWAFCWLWVVIDDR